MNEIVCRRQPNPKLWKLIYKEHNSKIQLTTFADTIVFDDEYGKKILIAVRFGGYPEQVRGMSDAIYGGGTVCLETGEEKLVFQPLIKQYRRMITHDGLYAEATLLIADDRLESNKSDEKQ